MSTQIMVNMDILMTIHLMIHSLFGGHGNSDGIVDNITDDYAIASI